MQLGQHLVGRKIKFKKFNNSREWIIGKVHNDEFYIEYEGELYKYKWYDEYHELVPLKIYEEFERAKELMLSNDNYVFICWALCTVNTGLDFKTTTTTAQKTWEDFNRNPSPAGKVIQDRLGDHTTLQDWIINQVGTVVFYKEDRKTKSMKATRLAWLDSLIAEFKAKNE